MTLVGLAGRLERVPVGLNFISAERAIMTMMMMMIIIITIMVIIIILK
jgi:hypothetical protein